MIYEEITEKIIGLCIKIHKKLGPGLFESVYEEVLCYELKKNNISFERQIDIPVIYDDIKMDIGFRADIIVENKLIWEAKILKKGIYDVYFYVSEVRQRRWRRNKKSNKTPIIKDYNFELKTADGVEKISVDLSKVDKGWFLIGSFFYLKGKTSIVLSDKTKGKLILADAVKWVKKNKH